MARRMKTCDAPRCGWDTETLVGKSNPFVCHKVWQNTSALLKTPFPRKLPFFAERVVANIAKSTAICGGF